MPFSVGFYVSDAFFDTSLFFPMVLFIFDIFSGGLLFFPVDLFVPAVFSFSFQSSNLLSRTKKISL